MLRILSVLDKVLLALGAAILVIAGYVMLIGLPVMLYSTAKCLEAGYPSASTTFMLKSYCVGIEGDVMDRVIPLDQIRGE